MSAMGHTMCVCNKGLKLCQFLKYKNQCLPCSVIIFGDEGSKVTFDVVMATFGTVGAFNEGVDTWERYVDRLSQYFEANEITEDARVILRWLWKKIT